MRDPDLSGIARAWKSEPIASDDPRTETTLVSWVINGPFHPAWSWWLVALISLREVPGFPPAKKEYPDAEYELMIASLNPDCCPPDPDVPGQLAVLTPIDLAYQFDVRDDEAAIEIVELAVKAIVGGQMSPDQDYRARWEQVLKATVAHYKQGVH